MTVDLATVGVSMALSVAVSSVVAIAYRDWRDVRECKRRQREGAEQ